MPITRPPRDAELPPLSDARLGEIRRRATQGFYDAEPVLKEVADALLAAREPRRARGGRRGASQP
ncbi:MAG: hypothetical protein ABIL09_18165 [Gemmatimonadota bacterium]